MTTDEKKAALAYIDKHLAELERKLGKQLKSPASDNPDVQEKKLGLLAWYRKQIGVLETQKRHLLGY